MEVCPSAQSGVDIRKLIKDICNSDYYKADYESITSYFTSEPVDYNDAKNCLISISENL